MRSFRPAPLIFAIACLPTAGVRAQESSDAPSPAKKAFADESASRQVGPQQKIVQTTRRITIHKPIQIARDNQFIRDLEIRLADDFLGQFCVVVGNRQNRIRYNRVENVRIIGDPKRNIGGVLLRNTQATRVTGCLIQECGGTGLKGDAVWNVLISDTIIMNSGWAEPDENASCLLVSDFAKDIDGTNCVLFTGSILEAGPRQLVLRDSANFALAACKIHNAPGFDPRFRPNWPGIFIDNCRGPFALGSGSNNAAWMSMTKPIFVTGARRPTIKGQFVFAGNSTEGSPGPEAKLKTQQPSN